MMGMITMSLSSDMYMLEIMRDHPILRGITYLNTFSGQNSSVMCDPLLTSSIPSLHQSKCNISPKSHMNNHELNQQVGPGTLQWLFKQFPAHLDGLGIV